MKTLTIPCLIIMCVLFSCRGDEGPEGPIGPQGDKGAQGNNGNAGGDGEDGNDGAPGQDGNGSLVRSGFVSGSLTGNRVDGTEINVPFKYEYTTSGASNKFIFDEATQLTSVSCVRSSQYGTLGGYAGFTPDIAKRGDPAFIPELIYVDFYYKAPISPTTIFEFKLGAPKLGTLAYGSRYAIYPISHEQNKTYKIDYYSLRNIQVAGGNFCLQALNTSATTRTIKTLDGQTVTFTATGSITDGFTVYSFTSVTNPAGGLESAGLFAGMDYLEKIDNALFRDGAANDLSEKDQAGIERTLTNYVYNTTTGLVTFHYRVKLPSFTNSSYHTAIIEGDVEIAAYENTVNRVGHD